MCGINGFFNYSKKNIFRNELLINMMNNALVHRGPDDSGIWFDLNKEIYFGHRRLKILDLSYKGHQPMLSAYGTAIVYNGEIYNYKNLRKIIKNREFFSASDTEVLLYLYEEYSYNCLNFLNGMFAFALWDPKKKELFLARDQLGKKPLYYTNINGIFAFSSEIKSLLKLSWIKAELDEEAFYDFLTFNKVSPPLTMFKNIYKFHPGYMMLVGEQGIRTYTKYWEVKYSDYSSLEEEELIELILSSLEESVKNRMVSDVPVGAFLSGGVDSSSIVYFMNKNSSGPIKTYSIGFQDSPLYDERKYARFVSKILNTDHQEKIMSKSDITEFLPSIVNIFDEPLADATSIPIYFLTQQSRKDGTIVVMTGDGGDELFCGYRNWVRYIKLYPYYNFLLKLPLFIRRFLQDLYGLLDNGSPNYDILNRIAKSQDFFWGGASGFKESTKRFFLSEYYLNKIAEKNSYEKILFYKQLFESIPKGNKLVTPADWFCFMGIKDILPNYYLYRADRLGMANSVEIRTPFLDHNFVNIALSLLGKWKIKKGEPKYILKKAFEKILPREVIYRKKQGFCVPLQEWASETIISYLANNIDKFCKETHIFRKEIIKEKIEETKNGNTNYAFMLWNVYFLIVWFKKWLL